MFRASFSLNRFQFSSAKFGPRSLRHGILYLLRRREGTVGLGFRVFGLKIYGRPRAILVRPNDNFLHTFSVHNVEFFFSLQNCGIFFVGCKQDKYYSRPWGNVGRNISEGLGISLSLRENFEYFCSGFGVQIAASFSRCANKFQFVPRFCFAGHKR